MGPLQAAGIHPSIRIRLPTALHKQHFGKSPTQVLVAAHSKRTFAHNSSENSTFIFSGRGIPLAGSSQAPRDTDEEEKSPFPTLSRQPIPQCINPPGTISQDGELTSTSLPTTAAEAPRIRRRDNTRGVGERRGIKPPLINGLSSPRRSARNGRMKLLHTAPGAPASHLSGPHPDVTCVCCPICLQSQCKMLRMPPSS